MIASSTAAISQDPNPGPSNKAETERDYYIQMVMHLRHAVANPGTLQDSILGGQKRACGKLVGAEHRSSARRSLGGPTPPRRLERLGESSLQKFAELRRSLELWNGIQLLECRGERIGETPDRTWPKLLVLRLEVEVMHATGQVFGSFQLALNERLVDDHLGGDVSKFTSLPELHLFSHRLEVSLHAIDTDRDAVDE